jgi:histidinol-phosphate phosphatase family protein
VAERGLFLDRDGTLIEDVGYPRDPDEVRLLPGAADALRRFRELGFRLAVVSNQSGIGRGLITQREADAVHARFVELLEDEGVPLDDVRYCPHAPEDGCDCRKPAPRLVREAAEALDVDLGASLAVGDQPRDLEAARAAGCPNLIFLGAEAAAGLEPSARVARDWPEVEALVLEAVNA